MAIRIFIDQGHNPGWINVGASAHGLTESEITYQTGRYLAGFLYADCRFEVRLSRPLPDTVLGHDQASSLRERVDMANAWPADYFISIHANSNANPSIRGSEVYVYRSGSAAYDLAQDVLEGIVETMGTKDNQVRIQPSFYVLRKTTMPALLTELAYISNEQDAQKLRCCLYGFAFGMYQGMLRYFRFV